MKIEETSGVAAAQTADVKPPEAPAKDEPKEAPPLEAESSQAAVVQLSAEALQASKGDE